MKRRILASLLIVLLAVAYVPNRTVHAASITLVASSAAQNLGQGNTSTITCTLGASAAVGDLVVMYFHEVNARAYSSTADDGSGGSNTYTQDIANVTLGGATFGLVRSVITHSGALTITVTVTGGTTGGSNAQCAAFNSTNGWPASPKDTTDTGSGSSNASSLTTGFTTAQASEVVLMFQRTGANRQVTNATSPVTFNDLIPSAGTSAAFHSEYVVTSATGTFQNAFSWTTSTTWQVLAVAYKDNAATSIPRHKVAVQ